MKDNNDISTEELNLLSEEMESIDKQLTQLDLTNPVEESLQKKLKYRMKVIAKAFQGHKWAKSKLKIKNVSGFYQ